MSILGFLFFIVVIILVAGLSVISSILRAIFGIGKRKDTGPGQSQTNSQKTYGNNKDTVQDNGKKREKYFDKNEGEYVDFEEIKDSGDK